MRIVLHAIDVYTKGVNDLMEAACNAFSEIVSISDVVATQKLRCMVIRDGHNFSI